MTTDCTLRETRAWPQTRRLGWFLPVALVLAAALGGPLSAQVTLTLPANDSFAGALAISGYTNQVTGATSGAGAEAGEPAHAGQSAAATVWVSWTAPGSGLATFDTRGSDYDTVLAVYTGAAVDTLTPVAANDDVPGAFTSRVTFSAEAGTVYRIAVDGFGGATGGLILNGALSSAPFIVTEPESRRIPVGAVTNVTFTVGAQGAPVLQYQWRNEAGDLAGETNASLILTLTNAGVNDAANFQVVVTNDYGRVTSAVAVLTIGAGTDHDSFADARPLSGDRGQVTGSTVGATAEFGEPAHAGQPAAASVWANWTAPADGPVNINTRGSDFDTVLAVYVGDTLGTLAPIVANDDESGLTTSAVTFEATAGTVYRIAVEGFGGATGALVLNWALELAPIIVTQPESRWIPAGAATNVTFTVGAQGAPVLRYQWRKDGAELPGQTNASLTLSLASASAADAGNFQLSVSNDFGGVESAVAVFSVVSPPGNDAFASRAVISGVTNTVSTGNLGATLEGGEPFHGDVPNGASVWWTWKATRNGLVQLNLRGSTNYYGDSLNAVLAVYTGTAVDALTPVAANVGPFDPESPVTFRAAAGTLYHFAVAGRTFFVEPEVGQVVLNLTQAPDNDYFVNRLPLLQGYLNVLDNNEAATTEDGEPATFPQATGRSVWWKWVAPSNGYYFMLSENDFRAVWAVYTGASVNSLQLVATNNEVVLRDEGGSVTNSYLFLRATGGEEYAIAVDGTGGAVGNIKLSLFPADDQPTENATFDQRRELFGADTGDAALTVNVGKEAGEPNHAGDAGGKSVWWKWTAPADGTVHLNTEGSNFDTLLAVYTGDSLNNLTLVAENDGEPPDGFKISRLLFTAAAGKEYQIAVDGFRGDSGLAFVNLHLIADGGNDQFANRFLLAGQTVTVSGVNTNATKEPGEPNHYGNRGGKSVWWGWVAPESALVTIDTFGSDFDTVLAVYTGSEVTALTYVASDDEGNDAGSTVTFLAVAGVEYQIAVDGYRNGDKQAQGIIQLNLRQHPPGPQIANDAFENATPLDGVAPIVIGANLGATRQPGEPHHSGVGESHSAWWSYTPLTDGPVTISTKGSELDTVLGVYVGTAIGNLSLVAENDDPELGVFHAQVTFQAGAGTTYYIAVDGYRGAMGLIRLSVVPDSTLPSAPSIQQQPAAQARFANGEGGGSAVEFRIVATGDLPLTYQWRRNDVPLENTDRPVLRLEGASAADAGTYQVVVSNAWGTAVSAPAVFTQLAAPFNDRFADRIAFTGVSNTVSGSVLGATKEPDEPAHGGSDGGRSVWWTWTAPGDGPVEIDTYGSSFDATLAVYTGGDLSSLSLVKENDDLGDGLDAASRVLFTAVAGTEYQIAVDGFKTNSTTGNVVLNLRQPPSRPNLVDDLPDLLSVVNTGTLTLQPGLTGLKPLFGYQWYFNGAPRAGATNSTLLLGPHDRSMSGDYWLVVTNDIGSVTTRTARVWVQVPQQLLQPQRLPDGRMQIYFSDPDGTLSSDPGRFEVHHTQNPSGPSTVWVTNLGGITVANGKFLFEDQTSAGVSRRTYRVIEK